MKKENLQFKLLYVFGIIMIVAGHCEDGGISLFYDFFKPYNFHIAIFIFASGYFYKKESINHIGSYIVKQIKKLVIPMYIWNFIYGFFVTLSGLKGFTIGGKWSLYKLFIAPWNDGHQFEYSLALWFVATLFLVHIFNVLLRKILSYFVKDINEYIMGIIYLAFGLVGTFMAYKGYTKGNLIIIYRMLYFLPFYQLGILYKEKLENYDNKVNSFIYFIFVMILELCLIFINGSLPKYIPSWGLNVSSNILLPYLFGITGIAFWLRICKILSRNIKNTKIISLIGDNTFHIMIHHFAAFMLIKALFGFGNYFFHLFEGFDFGLFKTDLWYFYLPRKAPQFYFIYLVGGLFIPIFIGKIQNKIINIFKKKKENYSTI